MAEYINRERARFEAERYFKNMNEIKEDLDMLFCMLPAEDVAPVRHGRCKKSDGKDEWYTYYYTCVECGANMMVADSDYHDVSPNYCPNCGAKMGMGRGGDNG